VNLQAQSDDIVLVVPFSPGGPTDILARLVQKTLINQGNVKAMVEYKTGAGGDIATRYVATNRQPLFLMQSSGVAINAAIKPGTSEVNKLIPVLHIGSHPMVLVVPPKSKLLSIKNWLEISPTRPILFGGAGLGSISHIYVEIWKNRTQRNLIHIPYQGVANIIPDLINGTLDAAFIQAPSAELLIRSGKLEAVAVASPERLPNLPRTPTFIENGIHGMDYYIWYMIMSNGSVSSNQISAVQKIMVESLQDPAIRKEFESAGLIVQPKIVSRDWLDREISRYAEIVKKLNIQ
jgi:tripartite-type tricarboxylate transporter receptor subunit TctC